MEKKNRPILARLFGALVFLALAAALFAWCTGVFRDKTNAELIRPYYDEPDNSLDIVFVGSSHMMCGIYPMELYENHGYTSCVFCSSAQVIPQTYYQTVAALETQTPRLLVLDMGELIFNTKTGDKSFVHSQTDNIRYSFNKVRLIMDLLEPEERLPNFLNLVQYHDRWRDLTEADFEPITSLTKGARISAEVNPFDPPEVPDFTRTAPLSPYTDEYLRKTLDLCRERDIPVLLLYLPSILSPEQYSHVFSARDYAEEYGIEFLNLMEHMDELGIDYATDFRDTAHLNMYGAAKTTEFLGEYLDEHYQIDRTHSAALTEKWNADLAAYREEYPKQNP